MTGSATPMKLQEQVHDGVLAENVTKSSNMQGDQYNLVKRVFDIYTAHGAGNHAMTLAELWCPSTNISEDVTNFTRWSSGEISIVTHTRTVPISCKRQVMDGAQFPTLYGAQA